MATESYITKLAGRWVQLPFLSGFLRLKCKKKQSAMCLRLKHTIHLLKCHCVTADNPDYGNEEKKLREENVWKVLRQTERRCQQADAEIGARWTG